MEYSKQIETLIELFEGVRELYTEDGEPIQFGGNYKTAPLSTDLEILNALTNGTMQEELSCFLSMFGGCELFVNGVAVEIYEVEKLQEFNREMEEFPGQFMENFLLLGSDYAGDFLAVYFNDKECHFGNLHHEAWGEVSCWRDEAMCFAKFQDWLEMIMCKPEGSTIPDKEIKYRIRS